MNERVFSNEEYKTMLAQLTNEEVPSYDMLCVIAERQLLNYVQHLYSTMPALRYSCTSEDIMHDVLLRLIDKTVMHFIYRAGKDKPNEDPDEFCKWIFIVAKRIAFDRCREQSKHYELPLDTDIDVVNDNNDSESDVIGKLTSRDSVNAIFNAVLDQDWSAYKQLAWMAVSILTLRYGSTKIGSTRIVVDMLADKTLYELYDIIVEEAERLKWLCLDEGGMEKLYQKLNSEDKDLHRPYGLRTLTECFMKKGANETISDWLNRINARIKKGFKL